MTATSNYTLICEEPLNPEQIAQLVAEYETGARVAALMRAYGFGNGTVLGIFADHGVQMRNQGLAPEYLGETLSRDEAGESLARIGDRFGAMRVSCAATSQKLASRPCRETVPQ